MNKAEKQTNSKKKEKEEKPPKINQINVIDVWPSYATKRNASENHIILNKQHIYVLNEAQSKFPKNISQPKLLKYLEEYLAFQMEKHDVKENDTNPVKLQIYREIFDWLIESFQTYKPLLATIKKEYEINLSFLKDEIKRLEPMKEMLWTIAEERDQQIMEIRKTENKEITQLKKQIADLKEQLSGHDANNATLQYEVHELSKSLRFEHDAYRKEFDARRLLILDINELRAQIDDIEQIKKEKELVVEEDPIMLRLALEEAQKSHSSVVKKLSDTIALYSHSIPAKQYEILDNKHTVLLSEFKIVSEKLLTLEIQLKTLEDKYAVLNQQRDFYYLKYMELAKSSSPNTNLNLLDKMNDLGRIERWQELAEMGKSVSQLAQTILEDLHTEAPQKIKSSEDEESFLSTSEQIDDEKKSVTSKTNASSKTKEPTKENLAVMRTMIELMCELPPGSISPHFNPMQLLPILTKEKTKKDLNTKSKSIKHDH